MMKEATFIMISAEELESIKMTQQKILNQLLKLANRPSTSEIPIRYITALEFMKAVNIKRTKFDELVAAQKLTVIKKKRKIYLPVNEVERFFSDRSIR